MVAVAIVVGVVVIAIIALFAASPYLPKPTYEYEPENCPEKGTEAIDNRKAVWRVRWRASGEDVVPWADCKRCGVSTPAHQLPTIHP